PTAVELLMISGLVAYYFGWIYVLIVLLTVGLYVAFTFWASERRIAIRRDMNDSDTEAHAKAVDSLLNYATVKYFGNEDHPARRGGRVGSGRRHLRRHRRARSRHRRGLGRRPASGPRGHGDDASGHAQHAAPAGRAQHRLAPGGDRARHRRRAGRRGRRRRS